LTSRWKRRARQELSQVQDLVRVLFKRRNGEPWTREDRAFLRTELRALAWRWSPGFFLFLLPGGLVLAPLYAALLDQRKRGVVRVGGQRSDDPTPAEALGIPKAARGKPTARFPTR
jgi:hypothetical protein